MCCGLAAGLSSCKSGDQDFPDFESQTCYFAKQYPVRTVELGNDLYVDLTRDNQHKVQIQATMGGAYSNPRDITIDFGIDASLDEWEIANKAIEATYAFFESIGIPMHLREVGIDESRLDEMAHHIAVNEGLENAYAPLTEKDIKEILVASL